MSRQVLYWSPFLFGCLFRFGGGGGGGGGGGLSHGVPNSRGGGLGLIVFCVFQRVAMWEVKVVVDWVWL